MTAFLLRLALAYMSGAALFLLLISVEVAFPRDEKPPPYSRLRGAAFFFVFITCTELLRLVLPHPTPIFACPVVAVVAIDFLYYWMHRAQHAIPFLWRFHAVHHSVENLNAVTGYHHASEALFKAVFLSIPVALFVPLPSAVVGSIVGFQSNFLHANTRLNFGRLGTIIVDNRTHRIHHSREPRHFNKNFAAVFMWDRLFGTAHLPAKDEWPDTGLSDRRECRSLGDYLLARSGATVEADHRPSDEVARA